MPLIVLTTGNVAALKRALKTKFPSIKSGHADESIAAGLGFKTHAALCAELGIHETDKQLRIDLNEARVSQRMAELGYSPCSEGELAACFDPVELPYSLRRWIWDWLRRQAANPANQN